MKVKKIKRLRKTTKKLNDLHELLRWSYNRHKYWHKVACIWGCLFGFSFSLLVFVLIVLYKTQI